jgi:hypothetical protein
MEPKVCVLTNHDYTNGTVASTDADEFFSPESRAQRRADELERIAEIERGWARMDAAYAKLPFEDRLDFDRFELRDQQREAYRNWDKGLRYLHEPEAIVDAKYRIELARIREVFAHLPEFQPWEPDPNFIYPVGYVERMQAEWLDKKIAQLRVVRNAELTLQIYALKSEMLESA